MWNYEIKYKDYECFIKFRSVTDYLIEYKCLCWNYQKMFDENLKKAIR